MTNLEQFKEEHKGHFTKNDLWVIQNTQMNCLPTLTTGNIVLDLFSSFPVIHTAEYLGKEMQGKDKLQSTINKVDQFKASLLKTQAEAEGGVIDDLPTPPEEKPKKESKTNEK